MQRECNKNKKENESVEKQSIKKIDTKTTLKMKNNRKISKETSEWDTETLTKGP